MSRRKKRRRTGQRQATERQIVIQEVPGTSGATGASGEEVPGTSIQEVPGSPRLDRRHAFAVGIFALALVVRLLFWTATPDSSWPHSAVYKGDALVWMDYAAALQAGVPFEQGLPMRPPGNGYLISWLWDGSADGVVTLKAAWAVMGAAAVALLSWAALVGFGWIPAMTCGLLGSFSFGLLAHSTSLNNDTPYLLLVAITFCLWQRLTQQPTPLLMGLWGALHAIGCLIRVEHVLLAALLGGYLALDWHRNTSPLPPTRVLAAAALVSFLAVLTPWHLKAWDALRDFNREPPSLNAATEQAFTQLEQQLSPMAWTNDAQARRQALPAYARRTASNFVAATRAVRGERTVRAPDFAILEQAFGAAPPAMPEHPFVVFYGGLNFYLANHPSATGGFDRAPLQEPPPLEGGAYPGFLIAGLPPGDLAFTYPPHAAIVAHGYSKGWSSIIDQPLDFIELCGAKLSIFWQGASAGFGGFNAPLGLAGPRRAVDLVTAEASWKNGLWNTAWLALLVAGLALAWRRRDVAAWPWIAFVAVRLVMTVAFFGYARHGALIAPVLFVATGVVIATTPLPRRYLGIAAITIAALLLGGEILRSAQPPELRLDGRSIADGDPWPRAEHRTRQLTVQPSDVP